MGFHLGRVGRRRHGIVSKERVVGVDPAKLLGFDVAAGATFLVGGDEEQRGLEGGGAPA